MHRRTSPRTDPSNATKKMRQIFFPTFAIIKNHFNAKKPSNMDKFLRPKYISSVDFNLSKATKVTTMTTLTDLSYIITPAFHK